MARKSERASRGRESRGTGSRKKAGKATEPVVPVSEQHRILWDHANDAITIVDGDGLLLQYNRRFLEMTGYQPHELKELYLEDLIHPEDLPMVRGRHESRLRGEECPSTYTARVVRRNGDVVHFQTTSSVIRSETGGNLSLDILRDITRQVVAEEELRESNAELVESNRRYQDLLDFMTHELKNPLTMLRAYSELLVEGSGGKLTLKGQRIAKNLWRGANRMEHLITTYLQLSRIEGGRVVVKRERTRLMEDIVREAAEALAVQLDAMDMKVVRDPDGMEDAEVWVDRELMQTAVQNIISNAIKYGYEGSPVLVRIREEEGRLLVSFRNEGVGIPTDHLEDVFNKYRTVASQGDNPLRSSGIGLYLVRRIMDEHGGDVWMDSSQEEWAQATIALPRRGD